MAEQTKQLKNHPAADAFTMMDNNRYAELLADIKANGQRVPIVTCDGLILDGRNRYKACLELNIEPIKENFSGDPWAYVWSLNGLRRDLNQEQRYLIWKIININSEAWQSKQKEITDAGNAKRAEATKERIRTDDGTFSPVVGQFDPLLDINQTTTEETKAPKLHTTRIEQAKAAKVSPSTVKRVETLIKQRPDLAEKVRLGEIIPSVAHSVMVSDKHKEAVAVAREALVDNTPVIPAGLYGVVVIDPPWDYKEVGGTGSADFNPETNRGQVDYPTMTIEEISQIELPLDKDAVVFLWTTPKFLPLSFAILNSWGLEYKTTLVWDKQKMGMGRFIRNQCEYVLIATKGKPLVDGANTRDILSVCRREHSRKPDEFYAIVEGMTTGRRIDWFSREARKGWSSYGNDTKKF